LDSKGKKAYGVTLTEEEEALLDPTLNPKFGYNLDAWDGYPIEREMLLTSVIISYTVLAVSWWFWQVTRTMPGTRTLPPVAILQLKSVD